MSVDNQHRVSIFKRVFNSTCRERKSLLVISLFTILFFYKFFFFGYLYNGVDILNHWYYPWAARPDLRQQMPENKVMQRIVKLGEKSGLGPIIRRPGNPELSDPVFTYNPSIEYCVKLMKKGELPFWNHTQLNGFNMLGDVTFSPFYPLNVLYFVPGLSSLKATTIKIILTVYLMGVFSFFLFRDMGRSRLASTAAALVVMFCAQSTTWLEYISFLDAYVWMPLLLLLYRQYVREGTWPQMVIATLAVGAILLCRNPKPISYIFAFFTLYVVVSVFIFNESGRAEIWRKMRRSLWFSVFTLVVGVMLGSILTLPMLEAIGASDRTIAPDVATFLNPAQFISLLTTYFNPSGINYSLRWASYLFVNLFFPKFYGSACDGEIWSPLTYTEANSYIGVLPLAFVFWSFCRRKNSEEWFFASIALFCFLAICWIPPFYQVLCFFIPTSGMPRVLFIVAFCIACLFAIAIDKYRNAIVLDRGEVTWLSLSLVLTMFSFALAVSLCLLAWPQELYDFVMKNGYFGIEYFRQPMKSSGAEIPELLISFKEFKAFHLQNFIIMSVFCGLTLVAMRRKWCKRNGTAFLILLFFQLAYFSFGFNPTILEKYAYIPTDTTKYLAENSKGYRIAKYKHQNVLPSGPPSFYGIDDAMKKVTSISLREMFRLYANLDPESGTNIITGIAPFSSTKILKKPLLDAMAIKYVISSDAIPEIDAIHDGFKREFSFIDGFSKANVTQVAKNYVVPTRLPYEHRILPVILANPPSELVYRLTVPQKAEMKFGIMMNPDCWAPEFGDGVSFEILIQSGDSLPKQVFSKTINPKSVANDRRIFSESFSMESYEGKEVVVIFKTEPMKDGKSDWALWVDPVVTVPFTSAAGDPLERFKEVWDREGVHIYENRNAMPRAMMVYGAYNPSIAQNEEKATSLKYKPNAVNDAVIDIAEKESLIIGNTIADDFMSREMIIIEQGKELANPDRIKAEPVTYEMKKNYRYVYDVHAKKEGYLYVADTFDKGWTVSVNEKPAEILKANYAFRAVYMPPGKHTVVMEYDPPGFRIGVKFTFLGFFCLVLYSLYMWQHSRRKKS